MPETIAHYEVLDLLGTGGWGTVYRARDTRVGRTVAIRVLGDTSGSHARRARFIESAQAFTEVSHPHVATLFDVGEHDACAYLVYEFVPGERLGALAGGRPLNLRRALDLCTQVADGLAEAHAFGLVHGALTPGTIVVTPKGHVKVLDFGLSAWRPGAGAHQTAARLADRGAALGPGAVGYLAPEQVLGLPADFRADLFSLGVILYELLTGRQPFDVADPAETGVRIVQHTPPPPSRIQADVPPAVDLIVARATAKDVDDRYDSAATFAADLRAASSLVLQRETAADIAPPVVYAPARPPLWRTFVLLSLLVAALAVTGWTLRDSLRETWSRYFGARLTPVVALMPFSVADKHASRAYVGSGMAEEVARRLGQIPGMTVKGRSTIRAQAGKPPVTVAADAKASLVVTGSVGPGPSGWSTLDLRVELADGQDGRSLWSRRYTSPARDIGAVHARVARDVAERLGIALAPSAAQDRSALRLVDPDAYDAYLQGRDALAAGDTAKATMLFENAIMGDPSLVEAQAALVEALYYTAVFDVRVGYAGVLQRLQQTAEEAETADPDLATVQLARGLSASTLHESFEHLRRAIELDPSYANAYLAVADILRDIDPARAMRFARRAAEFDPGQPLAIYQQAAAALALGQYAETLTAVARGQALAPAAPWWDALRLRVMLARPALDRGGATTARGGSDFVPGAVVRAALLAAEGRRADALGILGIVVRVNPGSCHPRALLVGLTLQDGRRAEAQRMADEIQQAALSAGDQAPWARCAAMAAASIGDAGRAAFWIGRASADERALRLWNATNAVLSPQAAIRQQTYPWSNVIGNAAVSYAVASMESALVRARADAAKVLEGLDVDRH